MATQGFALFATEIGCGGIVWSEAGIAGVQLPEANEAAARARLQRRFPGALERRPSDVAQRAIDGLVALLRGEPMDLAGIKLDMRGVPAFHRNVYEIARTIPPGSTVTYGEIAKRLGDVGFSQAVGQALGHNPFPLIVPCHRVLAAGGKTGGFSANGGVATKVRLLTIEGALPSPLPLFDHVRKRGAR